jgi:hypothetical protein
MSSDFWNGPAWLLKKIVFMTKIEPSVLGRSKRDEARRFNGRMATALSSMKIS